MNDQPGAERAKVFPLGLKWGDIKESTLGAGRGRVSP